MRPSGASSPIDDLRAALASGEAAIIAGPGVTEPVLEAVIELGAPICTTSVVEIPGLESVAWDDEPRARMVLRGEAPGVVHLHGLEREPAAVLRELRSRPLVLMGFGADQPDAPLAALRSWVAAAQADKEHRRFLLVRESERHAVRAAHREQESVEIVIYGRDADDLAPFLRTLAGPAPDEPPLRQFLEEQLRPMLEAGDRLAPVHTMMIVGDIALEECEHDAARESYERALRHYREAGSVHGEAKSIERLGDVALACGDLERAREHFERARAIFRRIGDVCCEAGCTFSLGDVLSGQRGERDRARECYERAARLYREVGSALGEANCLRALGGLARRRRDHGAARAFFEEARSLYRQIGDELGELDCEVGLGRCDLRESDHDAAGERFEQALQRYRALGDRFGEADSLEILGDLAYYRRDYAAARQRLEQALLLWESLRPKRAEAVRGKLGVIAARDER